MLRKFLISLPLMALLVAGGLFIAAKLIATKPSPVRKDDPMRPARVEVYHAARQKVQEKLIGYGTARADEMATISAQVGGKVVEVADGLEDGSAIKADQVLVRIEEDDYRYQLERASNLIRADQASLEQIKLEGANLGRLITSAKQDVRIAEDEYKRVSGLFENKVAAKREFDLVRVTLLRATRELDTLQTRLAVLDPRTEQAKASMAAHRAEVALAQLSLDRCRIVAPFDGRLRRRQIEVGETVAPGRPLMVVLKLDRIEVPIELPASCASKVEVGNECALSVESMPSERWTGRVERLGPAADEMSRTFTAYVVVVNGKQPKPLLPGLFVRAEGAGPVHADALVVPRGAIRTGAVFVAVDGVAHRRPIELTCSLRDMAVVRSGIEAGDAVILTNLASLRDQMSIELEQEGRRLANSRGTPSPASRPAGGL